MLRTKLHYKHILQEIVNLRKLRRKLRRKL